MDECVQHSVLRGEERCPESTRRAYRPEVAKQLKVLQIRSDVPPLTGPIRLSHAMRSGVRQEAHAGKCSGQPAALLHKEHLYVKTARGSAKFLKTARVYKGLNVTNLIYK